MQLWRCFKSCHYHYMAFCCLHEMQCEDVKGCLVLYGNKADARIRVRAKRFLRKAGVPFQNEVDSKSLIVLVKLVKQVQREAKHAIRF